MKKTIFLLLCLIMMWQAVFSLTVNSTAGGLSTAITTAGGSLSTVTNLTVTGTIDARDFLAMRDNIPLLAVIDISGTSIVAYSTYPENQIPLNSFYYTTTGKGKTTLKTITLPTGLTSIGTSAFSGCTGITSITLPYGLTSIEGSAFSKCYGITSLILPNTITSIGSYAFLDNAALLSLNLPNSLVSIGNFSFSGCFQITGSITFPIGLTNIGGSAFQNCYGIKTIYCVNPAPAVLGSYCFNGLNPTDVYVPTDAAVTAYKANTNWIVYFPGTIIKKGVPSAVPTLTNSNIKVYTNQSSIIVEGTLVGEKVSVYNLIGTKLQTVQSNGDRLTIAVRGNGIYLVNTASKTVKVVM